MIDIKEVEKILQEADFTMERYDRDHLDAFLAKINPKFTFPAILIAGSNGKGEVQNYLEGIYLAAGYKVAGFSKPVGGSFLNQTRLGGKPIDPETFARFFESNRKAFAKFSLSRFEMETLVSFLAFEEYKPDIAVIECGMGGRDDATNIIDPILSVITSVSLEHTAFLGRSVSEIALNKAGIMRDLIPVVVGHVPDAAKDVIVEQSNELRGKYLPTDDTHNELVSDDGVTFDYTPYRGLKIKTPALYAAEDAGIAIEAVKALNDRLPVSEDALRKGLLAAGLAGRFEVRGNVLFDGAHNPEACEKLCEALNAYLGERPYHIVFASFRDKNLASMLPILGKDATTLALTTFDHPRAREEMDYFLYAEDYRFYEDWKEAYRAIREQHPDDMIVFTGSLAFVYLAREEDLH